MASSERKASDPARVSGHGDVDDGTPRKDGPKPLLASEVLREDLAPSEPARVSARWWLLGVAVSLGMLGLGYRFGVGAPGPEAHASRYSFTAAAILALVAGLPFPYLARALLAFGLGLALMALGVLGQGPLFALSMDGGAFRDAARLTAATVLPAALLFRVSYRAYPRARVLLGAALLISLPFFIGQVLLTLDPSVPAIVRWSAGLTVAVLLSTLFGFMGSGTTGASSLWASLLLGVLSADIALRQFTPLAGSDTGSFGYLALGTAILGASVVASVGLYQLLAAAFSADAREFGIIHPAESLNDGES